MLERQFTERVLGPEHAAATDDRLEVIGAFNPGVVEYGGKTVLLARVVQQPVESGADAYPSPRYTPEGLQIDWLPADETETESDPRSYTSTSNGTLRLRFISHFQLFFSEDGVTLSDEQPDPATALVLPEGEYEEYGIEDPRVVLIDGTYYITYVAVSRHGVATGLMSTTDFHSFTRHGIILPPDNKDVLLFPQKIGGDYAMLHRPMPNMAFSPPQVWVSRSPDLVHWGMHRRVFGGGSMPAGLEAVEAFRDRVGGSTPPILTDRGWLTIFHGSNKAHDAAGVGAAVGTYSAGVLLLDTARPSVVRACSAGSIMAPEAEFETHGFVDRVVFPTALLRHGELAYVYYGAADECTGVTAFPIDELLDAAVPVD
ncbi:MAG: hypothetical protein AAGI68_09055 [Planctomycetota bacterium]